MNDKRMEIYAAVTIVIAIVLVGLAGGGGSPDPEADQQQAFEQRELFPLGEKIIAERIEDDPSAWEAEELPADSEPSPEPAPAPGKDDPSVRERENFQHQADYTYSILPTQDALRSLEDRSIHGTPAPIERAGRSLSRIRRSLESRPGLLPEGLAFYRRCALSQDLSHSVRALCLSNYRHFSLKDSEARDPSELEKAVPQGIVQASRALDPIQS